jgi:hypothetical protein
MWSLSGIGNVPTLNKCSDVWDRVESYGIHMLLTCRLKITFTSSLKLIISFLVSTYYYLLHSLDSHSSPVRVGMLLFLFLSCCISGLGPRGLLQMLALVISQIFYSGVPFEIIHILGHFVFYPKNLISIDLDHWRLTILFAMPTAVALLQWTGVLC